MTELILTEKYSVASDFAKALGITRKGDGCFRNAHTVITWAVGHLVELYEPEDYDQNLKKWRIESLPVIPEKFKYKPIKQTHRQFKVIKSLLKDKSIGRIIIATDAGREGEVIARTILLESGFTDKDKERIFRFWTSQALVPDVVRSTMNRLKPITHYDRLWRAGYYRQTADWLVGMNCTRMLTLRLHGDLFSVGRVQTAVLALIVDRKYEREKFVPETYWIIKILFSNEKGKWTGQWFKDSITRNKTTQDRITQDRIAQNRTTQDNTTQYKTIQDNITQYKTIQDNITQYKAAQDNTTQYKTTQLKKKEEVDTLCRNLRNHSEPGVVTFMKKEKKTEPPPFLFSLTDLQQEANRRFGFPAKKTLNIAQTLYQDKKCLSYPRTDARVLGSQSLEMVNTIVNKLRAACPELFQGIEPGKISLANKRVFNDAKLTDHHALIPFKPLPAGASSDEYKIFDLVSRRFAAAFHPDCRFENTIVITQLAGETFQTRGRVILRPGWRAVYQEISAHKENAEPIPPLVQGDPANPEKITPEEKKTTPPPDYTDSLILKDMTNPGKYVEEEEIKKLYRGDTGIGTQATRAQIIETLISRQYIQRSAKKLIATEKGTFLVDMLRKCPISSVLTSPEETARWEMHLNSIALGESRELSFLTNIKKFVTDAVNELKLARFEMKNFHLNAPASTVIGACPACREPVRETRKTFSCSSTGCSFVIWKKIAGKIISPNMASNLLKFRKSGPFKGFISRKKKKFSASLILHNEEGEWKVSFDFDRDKKVSFDFGKDKKASFDFEKNNKLSKKVPEKIPDFHSRSKVQAQAQPQFQSQSQAQPQQSHVSHKTGNNSQPICPMCGGEIIEGKKGYGCSNWRPEQGDCHFVIWKEIMGKKLTSANIHTLIAGKTTRSYVLKDSHGGKFKGKLKMVLLTDRRYGVEIIPDKGSSASASSEKVNNP